MAGRCPKQPVDDTQQVQWSTTVPEKPLISICLPTFNGQRFLAEALDSILAQTYENFELLIGDDCSTDETQSIIDRYRWKDRRIQSWTNEHRLGLFANYNRCMQQARGDLIKLFAQDDLLEPENLEQLSSIILNDPEIALVGCNKHLTVEGDLFQDPAACFDESGRHSGSSIVQRLLTGFKNIIGEPSTVLFRRESTPSGFDTKFYHLGDTDLWISILNQGDYYHLHQQLCTFRQHPEAATVRNVKGLLIGPDLFRLGAKYSSLLSTYDISPEDFRRKAVECLVSFLQEQNRRGLAWEDVAAVHKELGTDEDTLMLFQIVFFSLLHGGELHDKLDQQQRQKALELKSMEDRLSSIVHSESWKITQPLRDAKQIVGSLFNQ